MVRGRRGGDGEVEGKEAEEINNWCLVSTLCHSKIFFSKSIFLDSFRKPKVSSDAQTPAIMKWPKRHRNQATHVFTHGLNTQGNKGKGCHELCMVSKIRSVGGHSWLPSRGRGPQKAGGKRERHTAVEMLFLNLAEICLFVCMQGGKVGARR